MADVLEFSDLLQENRGAMNPGKLKLQNSTLTFKNMKTGKLEQYQGSDIERAFWLLRARGQCLKLNFKSGTTQKFDGFREGDYDKLSDFIQKNYQAKLEKKELSLKGWNWGVPKFNGNTLDFRVENHSAFEIPLTNISHSLTAKNEVTLEFHQNDDASVSLMELRFHIPTDPNSENDPVSEFHQNVMSKADVVQATGESITIFSEVQCLTPRGRYDIKIFPSFLQLHGKTFDYKIPYTTVLRLFLLPHRDSRQFFFVVSLDPPIKQGQTRYHFLILVFSKEVETTLQLSISEEDIEKKYEGKLQTEMSGPEHEVISRIMKVLVNKKITVPGSFLGHTRTHSIACSYKAATGFLYPLERGFIFVHKPPLHIRFDEIGALNFGRSAGSTRSFDFDIETTSGPVYNFVGIEKDEYGHLFDFVKEKGLRVKNVDKADGKTAPSYKDDMEESDDEGDRVHNAYIERMKKEGKGRHAENDDDDDDESDVSFKPEGSASEPDDEYDSHLESTSESEGAEGADPLKKAEKKEKHKKQENKGSDVESDEEIENKMDEDGKVVNKKEKKKSEKPEKKDSDAEDMDVEADVEDDDDDDNDEKEVKKKEKKNKIEKKSKESGRKKSKKEKKERDADKPKRSQSAFFLWLGETRSKIKEEFPGISVTDLTKKAGERWKEIKDKSKWEKMAAKEKEVYEEAMTEYKKNKEDNPSKSTSVIKKSSASNGPSTNKKQTKPETNSLEGFKSKEFISDNESSASQMDDDNDEDIDDKKKEKKAAKKKEDSEEEEIDEEENAESSNRDSD